MTVFSFSAAVVVPARVRAILLLRTSHTAIVPSFPPASSTGTLPSGATHDTNFWVPCTRPSHAPQQAHAARLHTNTPSIAGVAVRQAPY